MKPTLNQTIREELYQLWEQEEFSREVNIKRPSEGVCMDEGSVPMDNSMPESGNMHLFEGCTEPLWQSNMPTPTGPRPMCSSNSCTDPNYPANPNGPYACYNCGNTMWQAHVAFYQHVGSPNPGDVVHVNHTACSGSVTFCLRYVGYEQPAGTTNMQILADVSWTPENSCKDCEDGGSGTEQWCCIPGTPCFDVTANPQECDFGTIYPSQSDCQKNCGDPRNEDKGCTDPNAINDGVCCNGDPACTVVGSNPECCRYEDEPCPPQDCGKNMFWDPVKCECVCDLWLNCKKPLVFNPQTCQCEKKSPGPSNDFPIDLAEEIKRIKELLG
jgi:hypothetical protein